MNLLPTTAPHPASSPDAPGAGPGPHRPSSAELAQVLAQGPLGALLLALDDRPGLGWMLKDAATLGYASWQGSLPHADPTICNDPILVVGQTDATRFERAQAAILRVSDLRAIQQAGRAAQEEHRFETLPQHGEDSVREWRCWRWAVGSWLLVVWADLGVQQRQDALLAQAQRQLQAQQLLISQLQAQTLAETAAPGLEEAARQSQGWAREHFATQLRREIDLSQREHRSVALLLVEVAQTELSPRVSAAASALVARILSAGTRVMDTVAQIAPSRFGVILSGAALTPAHARAEALRRQAAAQQIMVEGRQRSLGLAIGLAVYPHNAQGADSLTAEAQAALQEALQAGGHQTVIARVHLQPPPTEPQA